MDDFHKICTFVLPEKDEGFPLWPHVCTPGTVFHYMGKFAGEFEYYLDSAVTSNTKPQLMGSAEFSSHCSLAQ